MNSSMIEIKNDINFSNYVFTQKELTIVQFHDENNASCHIMSSIFNKVQEFYSGSIICFNVRKKDSSEIYEQFKIYKTPSYLLIKEGKIVDKISGMISYDNFISIVKSRF